MVLFQNLLSNIRISYYQLTLKSLSNYNEVHGLLLSELINEFLGYIKMRFRYLSLYNSIW